MKPQDMKLQFVHMRAEGRSYSSIAEELHISKATCTAWERELKEEIGRLQQEKLNELYSSYGMEKEARIRRIGDTLHRIDAALEEKDLSRLPPDKLLDYKLKYAQALREEFTGLTPPVVFGEGETPKETMEAFADIYSRVRRGDITPDQAGQEMKAVAAMLQAYQSAEAKERIDALDTIIRGA